MKHLFKLSFTLLLIVCTMASCSKDDNISDLRTMGSLSGKWSILNPNSKYAFFEFDNKGNYIVAETRTTSYYGDIVHVGKYVINKDNSITLSGIGTIKTFTMDNTILNFGFTLANNPNQIISLTASKSTIQMSSKNTALLCKQWVLINRWENNEPLELYSDQARQLFTTMGTYIQIASYNTTSGTETITYRESWQWKDAQENAIVYSNDNWETIFEETILELTDSHLKTSNTYNGGLTYTHEYIPYTP